jgi:hypothetical protein
MGEETLAPQFDGSAVNKEHGRLAGERKRVEGRRGELEKGIITPDGLMLNVNQGEGREAA